jgi:predicted P-loop ATPase
VQRQRRVVVMMHAPQDKTGTDTGAALKFIGSQFQHTEWPVNVCVLKNDGGGAGPTLTSRDPAKIESFIGRHDKPGQGVYFCVSTLSGEDKIHAKDDAVELMFAHADTDMKDIINETPESALAKIRALEYPPSRIVWSGHGFHSYWFFNEPYVLPTDATRHAAIDEYDNFLGVLCDFVGGDTKPAHVAGLMRVVGTHNTKNGEWAGVDIVEDNDRRYELSDLQEWQASESPKLLRKGSEHERNRTAGQRGNVWEQFAKQFRPPIDVEARLSAMLYMGSDDASIHETQIHVTSSMLSAGFEVEEIVRLVKDATRVASGDYGKRWNWEKEEKLLRNACMTWIAKHRQEIEQAQVKKKEGDNVAKPVDIDWTKVEAYAGWLKSTADLPPNFSATGKALVAHTGSIEDLKVDLKRSGVLTAKPISNWSEVAFALAMKLRGDGRLPTEKIAAALLCPLACNQHITKLPNDAEKRTAIERLMWRTQDHGKQQQATQQAKRQQKIEHAGEPDWRERRLIGSPLPSMHNARLAINALGIKCSRDTFHNKTLFGFRDDTVKHELQSILGEVTDDGIIALRQFMSDKFHFDLEDKATRDAVRSLAIDNCFNPVCDLIDKAQADWDGEKRLDKMAVTHFNCADTPLNRAFLRKTIIAMVARARVPGCKFDTITVLESVEGYNKSTAWRVMAGDENFSDEPIIGKGSREVQEQLSEVWLHENADLAGMKKAEVETVKAFASRTTDIARAAFAHFVVKQLRHSIETGSTNSEEYLQSQTGNRRFWPLRVLRAIDIAQLKRDRLQLIGEAATYQSAGESITLDETMWADAAVVQEGRRVKDAWEDILEEIPTEIEIVDWNDGQYSDGTRKMRRIDIRELVDDGGSRVASLDLLTHVLGIPLGQQTTVHSMRLSVVMKRLGWQRDTNKISIRGKQVRGFSKPKPKESIF